MEYEEERNYTKEALDKLKERFSTEFFWEEIELSYNASITIGDAMNVIEHKTDLSMEEVKEQMKESSRFFYLEEDKSLIIYFFINDTENFIEIPRGYWAYKGLQTKTQ